MRELFLSAKSLILLLLLGYAIHAYPQGYTVDQVPNDNLQNKYDFVTNPDGIISVSAEQQINTIINQVKDSTTAEIAVVLIKSIGDVPIDDFATVLFKKWGIGKKENDNGLLFLLVEDQRQMVFRTGYGLEGVLPDIYLIRIIRNDISPYMKEGDYDRGIINGISQVENYLLNPDAAREIQVLPEEAQTGIRRFLQSLLTYYLILAALVFFYFFWRYQSQIKMWTLRQDQYNALIGLKSGMITGTLFFPVPMIIMAILYFFKLNRLRNQSLTCPVCSHPMERQKEGQELSYLTAVQKTEEKIHSVIYDVWHCTHCGHNEVLGFDDPHSSYSECPHCHARAYHFEKDQIVKHPSLVSKGQGEKIYQCLNCHKRDAVPYIIPILLATALNSGRRGGGFGGGFGGGSIGGGFGGGRTGGGGARGGW